jgi:succinylarginine dihydrolase
MAFPCGCGAAQDSSARKITQADPLEDVLLLSKNLGILSNLAAKLTASNPERAAELLPKWKAQLNAATTVVAALDGMVEKVTANVDEQKKQIAKLPADKRELQRKFLTRLEEELDSTINRQAVLADATAGFEKQLAATEADAVVSTLVKNKEAQTLMDDKLKELNDAMERLQGGAAKTPDDK